MKKREAGLGVCSIQLHQLLSAMAAERGVRAFRDGGARCNGFVTKP